MFYEVHNNYNNNYCLILHVYKNKIDECDIVEIVWARNLRRKFVS